MLIANRTCTVYVATPHSDKRSEKSEQPDFLLIQPIDEHDLELLDNEVETMQSLSHKTWQSLSSCGTQLYFASANWLLKCACQWEDNPLEAATAARPNGTLAQARMGLVDFLSIYKRWSRL